MHQNQLTPEIKNNKELAYEKEKKGVFMREWVETFPWCQAFLFVENGVNITYVSQPAAI